MSFYLAPIANQQQIDSSGNPLSGGKINSYIAGTSTPATTYTDDSGGTAQANPIILNSRGLPASPVWLQGARSYKFVITDANDVVLQTIDDVSGINDPAIASTADQWLVYANPPTYISATSFSVAGDQTPTFQVNRRLKSTNTGGTIYSRITASAFAAGITTVTVTNDSGTLDSGLSTVSYGLLSNDNPSIPETAGAKLLRTLAAAGVIDRAYAEYTTNADLTALIPFDDTIPQVTEGTQILSASITPKSSTSRLRLRFYGVGTISAAQDIIIAALFVNGGADAVVSGWGAATPVSGSFANVYVEYEYVPGSTSAQAITVRVGATSGTLRLNGTAAARRLGGTARSTLVIEEIAA